MENINFELLDKPAPDAGTSFLYRNFFGRIILRLISGRVISKLAGGFMNTKLSRCFISGFVKKNNIDMTEYQKTNFKSFNEFFIRKIKEEKRPIELNRIGFISPCDSKLSIYKIDEDCTFDVKNSKYSVESMLENKDIAAEFINGYVLVFRLSVDDYHRVCFVDDGLKRESVFLAGKLHTVQPIATESGFDIYTKNCRSYSLLETDNFDKIVMCYIGALLVGRINENHSEEYQFKKGEEAGNFQFGGSTVVLLIKDKVLNIDDNLLTLTKEGKEIRVKYGRQIFNKL